MALQQACQCHSAVILISSYEYHCVACRGRLCVRTAKSICWLKAGLLKGQLKMYRFVSAARIQRERKLISGMNIFSSESQIACVSKYVVLLIQAIFLCNKALTFAGALD